MDSEESSNIVASRIAYIKTLSDLRYDYIDNQEESWNEAKEEYTLDLNKDIDELAEKILVELKEEVEILPFDFIFVELTKLGHSPALLYDDNGYFAVSGDGFQNINYGDEPNDMSIFHAVESAQWKKTPVEAMKHYLLSDK